MLSSSRGGASRGKLPAKWFLWLGMAVALVIAVRIIPSIGQKDPRQVIADLLHVGKERVTVNIPPTPARYPGGVLLAIHGDRVLFAPGLGDDPDLQWSETTYPLVAEDGMGGRAAGSMELPFFKEAVSNRQTVDIEFRCDDTVTVEMSVVKIREHLAKLGFASPGGETTKNRHVIYRALKGRVKYTFKKRSEASLETWAAFKGKMKEAAKDLPDLELRLEAGRTESQEFFAQFKTPTVFAFLAAEIDELLAGSPGSPPSPAPAASPSGDPRPAIEAMIDLGPARIPALAQAVRELGPKACAIVVEEMLPVDAERRDRAALMLQHALPPEEVAGATPLEALKSASVPARAWAVKQLEAQGAQVIPVLTQSLKDPSPAIRHLAITAVGARGQEAAESAPDLERALDDPDPGIRLRASGALLHVKPGSGKAITVLEKGLLSDDPRERRGASLYIGSDRLKELAERGEPRLRDAAARAMRETPEGTRPR